MNDALQCYAESGLDLTPNYYVVNTLANLSSFRALSSDDYGSFIIRVDGTVSAINGWYPEFDFSSEDLETRYGIMAQIIADARIGDLAEPLLMFFMHFGADARVRETTSVEDLATNQSDTDNGVGLVIDNTLSIIWGADSPPQTATFDIVYDSAFIYSGSPATKTLACAGKLMNGNITVATSGTESVSITYDGTTQTFSGDVSKTLPTSGKVMATDVVITAT